jgi:chromosome segregation ATPase
MELRLTSRLEQHEDELAGLHQAAAELPQMELRLTSRLEQHERALAGVQQVAAELPQMELRLTSRLEQHDGALAGVHQAAAEHTSRLDAVSRTLTAVQEQIRSLETRLAAARECADRAQHAADELTEGAKREAASLEVSLAGQLHSLEATVKSHAAAIDSIRAAMARTDDFMERVVEALESLQTMVLDHARERNVA